MLALRLLPLLLALAAPAARGQGRELWLGSFQSARIGIVPMPEPADTPASRP
ncbi:hypothetical protein [Novosphingobium sp. EMRT-2]|uniref:hypothetical protein n=1 Tax=Novosphingobium sp. EMRT-2 TaxID=2571749 RepID=UPI00143DAF5C|nr:hypothetical protein [Novosphingobium sp. EMRT-2]